MIRYRVHCVYLKIDMIRYRVHSVYLTKEDNIGKYPIFKLMRTLILYVCMLCVVRVGVYFGTNTSSTDDGK